MRSLLWKEWHEQRWKLALATMLLAGCTYFGLHARVIPDEVVLNVVCALTLILLPVLVGAVLIAPEREARTLNTLLALPVPSRKILAAKTRIGMALCVGPVLVACILSLLMAGNREMGWFAILMLFTRCALSTLSLFFWMLAFTVRLPTETRATLIGLGILIGWSIITLGLGNAENAKIAQLLWHVDPGIFMLWQGKAPFGDAFALWDFLPSLLAQAFIAIGLWIWADRQLVAEEARS